MAENVVHDKRAPSPPHEVPNPEKQHGEELKEKGNHFFKGMMHRGESRVIVHRAHHERYSQHVEGHYQQAIDMYTQAIQCNPSNAVYWSNRAFAFIKTEAYGYALIDSTKAVELDETFIKVCR